MAFNAKQQAAILALFGVIASETYGLDREALEATTFVPRQSGLTEWISAWGYKTVTEVGMAKFIADYADDLPPIGRFLKTESVGIKTLGVSYSYSEVELMQYLMNGVDVSRDDAETARRKIDEKVDRVILVGDEEQGVTGLFNNENVTTDNSAVGASGSSELEKKTVAEIVATFRSAIDTGRRINKGTIKFDTVILPSDVYSYLETTDVSQYNQTTILDSLKSKFSDIKNWYKSDLLEGVGAGKTNRAVFYKKTPQILSYVLPIPFRQKEAQPHALHYKVPCYARVGGTVIKNLKGIVYVDGV